MVMQVQDIISKNIPVAYSLPRDILTGFQL